LNNVVAIGGKVFTEATSADGAVITLAESGAGIVATCWLRLHCRNWGAAASTATGTKYTTLHRRLSELGIGGTSCESTNQSIATPWTLDDQTITKMTWQVR
jgi:hypothetical protein